MFVKLQIKNISIYLRTMTGVGIGHTISKLNIEAYTDEQPIDLGKNTYYNESIQLFPTT